MEQVIPTQKLIDAYNEIRDREGELPDLDDPNYYPKFDQLIADAAKKHDVSGKKLYDYVTGV